MPKFIVYVPEIHISSMLIEATDLAAARELVREGDGLCVRTEYACPDSSVNPNDWEVEAQ